MATAYPHVIQKQQFAEDPHGIVITSSPDYLNSRMVHTAVKGTMKFSFYLANAMADEGVTPVYICVEKPQLSISYQGPIIDVARQFMRHMSSGKYEQPDFIKNSIANKAKKVDLSLVIDDCPEALRAVAEVMAKANEGKYTRGSWRSVPVEEFIKAEYRHTNDSAGSLNSVDKDSHQLHLAHRASNLLMALQNLLKPVK
jgi:hypothetical protein